MEIKAPLQKYLCTAFVYNDEDYPSIYHQEIFGYALYETESEAKIKSVNKVNEIIETLRAANRESLADNVHVLINMIPTNTFGPKVEIGQVCIRNGEIVFTQNTDI